MKYSLYKDIEGVPDFQCAEWESRQHDYCVLIPVINEGDRILRELYRAMKSGVNDIADIVICDGDSTDGSMDEAKLNMLKVNALLVKKGPGKQGAQLRMGMYWALERGYKGIITIDGNNKDSIEHVGRFIDKLEAGYDFIQGSRFIAGGHAIRTPLSRALAVRLIHAPVISLTAGERFTDTTNNYRGYSADYLKCTEVAPFRDVFGGYELLAYLSVRASQLGFLTCEVPVDRVYPKNGSTPTKISAVRGNSNLMKILVGNAFGKFNP